MWLTTEYQTVMQNLTEWQREIDESTITLESPTSLYQKWTDPQIENR